MATKEQGRVAVPVASLWIRPPPRGRSTTAGSPGAGDADVFGRRQRSRWRGFLSVAMTAAGAVAGPAGVPLDDDHGDGLAATLLPLDRPLAGRLSDTGDVDAFRIDLNAAARVEVRTSGGTDTRGRLLDGSGAVRAEDDDSGPGRNFRLVAALERGVHYVEVRGVPGDYSVAARLADALDQGGTEAASTLLTLHEEQVRGATPMLVGASGRIWPSVSDVDVFRLDVPHHATDVTVRSSGSTALRARLMDSSAADIASFDRRGNIRMARRLDAGIYYVAISGDEVGAYRLLATGVTTSDTCARPPVARDDGSSPESATVLEVGGPPAAGTIADDADVDVFRLDLEGSVQVELRTSGGTDTRGELYDHRGDLIASDDASGPGGHNFRIVAELAAGIHYVVVTGAPGARGGYAVSARAGGAFDHPDVLRNATRLRVHDALDLARVTPDMLLGTAGRIWPSTADVDAFRLDVARDGMVVRIRTSGGTALHARLVHAGAPSAAVAADDRGGDIDLVTPLDAGVYYLLIGGDDTGAYRVLAWGYQAGDAPPDKAAFDELVAGRSLSGPSLDTVRVCPARGLFAQDQFTRGDYTYERGACPHTGWLDLEYGGGRRCTTLLSFDSADTGNATLWCDDGSERTSRFSIGGGVLARILDQRLADEIRYGMSSRWCEEQPITVADMASLRSLDASHRSVRDLTGLEHATQLTRLDLTDNEITDLGPLTGLTALERLYLWGNRISDLDPLADLTSLTHLSLGRNEISDLEPLTGLTALKWLDLDHNRVSDLEPLTGLTALKWLYLRYNRVSDLSPLTGLTSLTSLRLSGNEISDLSPLAGLAALERLYLRDNRISDISPLAGLTSLGWLALSYNQISDVRPLSGLGLGGLELDGNRISDISPLTGLAALHSLGLADNRISDLTPLASSTSLNGLDLSLNGISDLKPLADLRLWWLDLAGNRISDVSPLAGEPLSEASFLDLSDNDIADIAPLSGMTAIGHMDLSHNEIADLSSFSHMSLGEDEDFPTIRLQGNRIADASPLFQFSDRYVHFYYGGTIDLGHNAIVELPDSLWAAHVDLAGNRVASLRSFLGSEEPRYSLNVEGNLFTAPPRADSADLAYLALGGNAISDLESLLGGWLYEVRVSLWRNPLSRSAREEQLPALRDLEPGVVIAGGGQLIPLLTETSAARHPDRRGLVRLTNLGGEGDAWLYAPRLGDDARPVAVVLPARSVMHVDSEDVRLGARDKRLYGELPIGSGDTVLEVFSSDEIRAHAYIRSGDGFLTSVHDTAFADAAGRHVVPFFNPASNTRQRSLLRLVNMGGADTEVFVTGVDDAGAQGGPVKLVLAARAAATLDAEALENGTGAGVSGRLGDGEGRWRLDVSSDGNIAVASLVDGPTGHLTNLSTAAPENTVPLFPSASHPGHRGWVRVVNRGDATEVHIRGTDDAGTEVGPVTLRIAPGHAVEFDSHDWEHGNAAKGLGRGVGRGTGDWRLRFSSEGDILVGAYVETRDGFLSSIHDRAPRADESASDCLSSLHRWRTPGLYGWWACHVPPMYAVAPFMPPGGDGPVSSVRLANDGDDDATLAIWRVDESGNRAGPVELTLATGTARTVSAHELVEGGEGLAGWLRNSAGTWELLVTSSGGRVTVVNLLEDASGHVTNLSTAPYHAVIDEYR